MLKSVQTAYRGLSEDQCSGYVVGGWGYSAPMHCSLTVRRSGRTRAVLFLRAILPWYGLSP